MNVRIRSVSAVALGIVAIAGCSGSKSSGTGTTTTVPVARATTTTTARRRTETTTTTATTPTTAAVPSSSAPALSATFVSPRQGFALESTGAIAATTDGGRTWHRTGDLASHPPDEVIRFIDPADGFAFEPDHGPLLITHDGGASWSAVARTPFSTVADLAIARGTVYAVALSSSQPVRFRIWTTPVSHLVWKTDPLTLSAGAGPVPVEHIVLSGTDGWILDQNRTVIAGARLAPNGRWASWTPPCLHVNGPAFLAASTSSDLVASCNEGVWGPPQPAKTVYVSHDGGTSFTRRFAPVFGPVLSPNAQTAVVDGGGTLQRTTDGGAGWSVVAQVGPGTTSDWGFTTSTQGFVITGGKMLMTRDAGASWSAVTLP